VRVGRSRTGSVLEIRRCVDGDGPGRTKNEPFAAVYRVRGRRNIRAITRNPTVRVTGTKPVGGDNGLFRRANEDGTSTRHVRRPTVRRKRFAVQIPTVSTMFFFFSVFRRQRRTR